MPEPVQAALTGFAALDGSHGPEWAGKVEINFVVTREQARRFRIGDTWTLVPPEGDDAR